MSRPMPSVMGLSGRACMSPNTPARPPLITIGTAVRLPQTPEPMTIARVIIHDDDGRVTATLDLRPTSDFTPAPSPWRAEPAERPSPPRGPDCSCVGERHGLPVAHHGLCWLYSVEDEAWCRSKWVDAKTGRAPSYAEALATLRRGSSASAISSEVDDDLPVGYAVPSRSITVGQRCGTCQHCRGLMADPRCRYERIVVDRDAVRRVYAHAQAINPAALDPMGAHIYGLLVDEVGKLAAAAGIK